MMIACAAVAIGLAALRNWRAVGWVAALAVSFLASSFYWRAGMPYGEFFAGICDAAVCLVIYALGKYRWELAVWRMFQAMLLVNLLYLAGNIGIFYRVDHVFYAIILEALNILILLTIGGVAAYQRFGGKEDGALFSAWAPLHRALLALCARRRTAPFWRH